MKKNIIHYLIAFILPILIFCFAMYSMNVYPFGNLSIRTSDSFSQYPAFFEGLKNFNIFTFNIGLGENFYPIFTTYLCNPLNLLYFLFKKENFDLFYVILLFIKIGFSGLTMNILLNYKKCINSKTIIFSTIYALSGFVSLYYHNYQFLDSVYMLPLVMIAIDKIVNDNKNLMYFITLTYMIFIHYYTAYMICLFSVIYFFFLLYNSTLNKKEKKQRTIRFFLTSLLCGLSSAVILIPTINSLFSGRIIYYNSMNYLGFNKDGIGSLYNFIIGSNYASESVTTNCSAPIYLSLFVLVIILLHLSDKKKNLKLKKSIYIIGVIYLLSLITNIGYYTWHLFQKPIGFPGRFVFCFNAFWILIAYNFDIEKINIKLKNKIIILVALIVYFLAFFTYKNYIYLSFSFEKIYIWLLVLSNCFLIYYIFTYHKSKFDLITYFLVIIELSINLIMDININYQGSNYNYVSVGEYQQNIKNIDNLINVLKEDDNFFRMNSKVTNNDGLLFDYYGVNRFASIYNNNLTTFLKDYRPEYHHNSVISYSNNFLMDALLGLKYVIRNYTFNSSKISFLENKYYIKSLGFIVNNQNEEQLKYSDNDIIDILNLLTNKKYDLQIKYLNPQKSFENIDEKENTYVLHDKSLPGKVIFTYDIPNDIVAKINMNVENFFFEVENNVIIKKKSGEEIYNLMVNEEKVDSIYNLKKGDKFKIEINLTPDFNAIYSEKGNEALEYVKENDFKNLISELNTKKIENLRILSTGFTGDFTANDNDLLIITVPYDNSFEINIDNKKVNYDKILNGIISIPVDDGNHKIELKYHIKGLKFGIIISIISFLLFILYYRKIIKRQ